MMDADDRGPVYPNKTTSAVAPAMQPEAFARTMRHDPVNGGTPGRPKDGNQQSMD
jgi:hypothetical protein